MDWRLYLRVGCGFLSLPSDAFWRLTPASWAAALDAWCFRHGLLPLEPMAYRDYQQLKQSLEVPHGGKSS